MNKTPIIIIHYNTPELTTATIHSLRKQGAMGKVTILDNSDSRPFRQHTADSSVPSASPDGIEVIDNTQGQLIDFDAELKKYPDRDKAIGCALGCNFGSVKHMLSVQWMTDRMDTAFILCDSDILLKAPIDDIATAEVTACGEVSRKDVRGIPRLLPFLCLINAPECRRLGIRYFDPERSWGLNYGPLLGRNHYDTGASFLEDVRRCPEARLLTVSIGQRLVHLGGGSWRSIRKAGEWLRRYESLWNPAVRRLNDAEIALLQSPVFDNYKIQRIMDHVIVTQQDVRQWRLTAESGYLLRSKKSGRTFREIDTCDLHRWECIEDPAAQTKAESKPKTAKRAKGKKEQ